MPKRLAAWIFTLAAVGALAAGADEAPPPPLLETPEAIDACMRAPLVSGSSIQRVTFRSRDRQGNESWFDAKVYWKRHEDGLSRVLMRVTAPALNQGTALLVIQKPDRNDIFMYVPELKRVRRVTTRMVSSSVLGTDFSYEDFERLQGLDRGSRPVRLPDAVLEGRPVYVLETRPPAEGDDESAYGRVRSWVDQATCVPLKVEYFEREDEPSKVLVADPERITEQGGRHLPQRLSMTDRKQRTSTEIVVHEIELGVPLRAGLFTARELEFGTE